MEVSSITIAFIRPCQYDDDGYVIRYEKGVLPSNTLACMRSLTLEFTERWKRDHGIDITVETYDEFVEAVPIKNLARRNRGNHKVVAAFVGVQTNQFPRATDMSKRLSSLGIKSLIGGFHVSGVLAMFDDPTPEITDVIEHGVTVVQGEAEHVWESILLDVVRGREQPLYRMNGYPDISTKPVPQADYRQMKKKFAVPHMGTVDCSRGCPFNCSFCTIVNVQGHHMRCRDAETVLATIQGNYANGVTDYFFTDDNFSRNTNWNAIFNGLIDMRETQGYNVNFMMQVDTACDHIPEFVEKAERAGCTQVFIGMESLNAANLAAVHKNQNHIEDYAAFIENWHNHNIMTHVGYIIGFPFDTAASVQRDIDTLMNEVKVDQASFFILTPLPGSVDHQTLVQSNAKLDPDLNKYDSFHVVTRHPLMTDEEVMGAYQHAWSQFYSFENLKKVLMRAGEKEYWHIFKNIAWYRNSLLEPRHPMVAGFLRMKSRTDVRTGTPVMNRRAYYWMRFRDLVSGLGKRVVLFFELEELWMLTRKPSDPTFKFVADFTATLSETKSRIAAIEFSGSYTHWKDETLRTLAGLRNRIATFYNAEHLSTKTRKRFNLLIDDMSAAFERLRNSDRQIGEPAISEQLNRYMRVAEDFALKQVARRRKITQLWADTWQRLKHGHIFLFACSLPTIVVNGVRDFWMSLMFAYYVRHKKF